MAIHVKKKEEKRRSCAVESMEQIDKIKLYVINSNVYG